MICNKCGKELSEDATRCDNCFEEVEKIDVEKFKQSLKPKKNTKEKIVIVVLVLFLIFIQYILIKSIGDTDPQAGLKERKSKSNDIVSEKVNQINDVKAVVSDRNVDILNNAVELTYSSLLLQSDSNSVSFNAFYDKFKSVIDNTTIKKIDSTSFSVEFKQGGSCTITCNNVISVSCNEKNNNFDDRLKCTK